MIAFEDMTPGRVFELGEAVAEREEMIDFAKRYDPQTFHLDEAAASESLFRGLAASGWYTVGLWMRKYVDNLLADSTAMGSPGGRDVSWPAPVFAGDVLRCRVEVLTGRRSASRPAMGIVEIRATAHRVEDTGVTGADDTGDDDTGGDDTEQCVFSATFTALFGTRSG